MHPAGTISKSTYAGLFMVTLATLMHEILLTRIFSVTMFYHFAFMAVSIAMFGMTCGAVIVYLFPDLFTEARAKYHLAISAFWFAISIVFSFLTQLSIPFIIDLSIVSLYSIALTYVVISIPFVFSGICVCIALTKFPRHVGRLYAADLAGAALGCLALVYTLNITDGPTAVIVVAALAGAGSACFAYDGASVRLFRVASACALVLVLGAVAHTALVYQQRPLLRPRWVKGKLEQLPLYEKWNSFSRIHVWGNPDKPERPFGWGLSPVYPPDRQIRQLRLRIDATAGTVLTHFRGDLDKIDYLKYDVTNVAHYIRPDAKVFIIGVGGGRDVLSGLAFGQRQMVGVEMNEAIINALNGRFGDFTGHLDRYENVTFVADEARSYMARSEDKFDIIQMSLIDTWAATAAGAFVLAENSLYTVEAWKMFLNHLAPRGVLTVSRWYFGGLPAEVYRMTALASTALKQVGITEPSKHIILIRLLREKASGIRRGVGTILVSLTPFSADDLARLQDVSDELQFELALSPRGAMDPNLARIAAGEDLDALAQQYPFNISPPTDNNPFFFHILRLRDAFKVSLWDQTSLRFNMKAIGVLGALVLIVVVLTLLFIAGPLLLRSGVAGLRGAEPLLVFFAAIGLGFMFVEISQMQRLTVFLGHPTYGLSVVLFSLLLGGGLGSFSTRNVIEQTTRREGTVRLLMLLVILALFGVLTPHVTRWFEGSVTVLRILIAVGILFPMGFFMGMAFPLGMRLAADRAAALTPWLWGVNGSTSVCASVLAVAVALAAGISASFWTGFTCYVIAFGAFMWAAQRALRPTTA